MAMDEQQMRSECRRRTEEEKAALAEAEKKGGKAGGPGLRGGGRQGGTQGNRPVIDSNFIMDCLHRNELGDAELYKALYRDDFVFNKSMDRWMQWTGHYWIVDKMDNAMASVEGVAMVYQDEARRLAGEIREMQNNEDETKHLEARRDQLNKRVSALRSSRRRKNCLMFAHTSADPLAIDGTEIDQKPWLLPCANGVLNLKTGELEPGRQQDYLLKASPLVWPEEGINAPSELWEKSLHEIFDGNVHLVDFWRRLCGYSLVGEVYQSVFVVMTGQGRNGKTMIMDMLTKVLGPMAGTIRPEMLLDNFNPSSSSGASADIMTLRGLRMAFASETDEGRKISPSRVKWLTGRDPIRGRNPYDKYEVEWTPSHTLILLTNHKPHAPADDFAFWERMKVIPFTLSFVDRPPTSENERRADPMLYKKLEKELPGIFAWMVRGCLEWQQVGLDPPSIVKAAVDEYQKDEDSVGDFIEECCITGPGYSVGATALYQRFEAWWKENVSNRIPKQRRFGDWMKKKKFEKVKSGTIKYNGIGLLDGDDSDSQYGPFQGG
ncbi:phage/plasmid primase, P4 family [Desulfotignum phosphitoxidans DSM 13687]|uniref:Phage/plasmid primase, P4 family n=2 Tax=Desulfotignum phosphitoxidans TaxID=190898 RepID=S0G4E6_9BACT|nr:phage/plasmid primase, P4 family [Desulfotignum phosphitoxidans DSM 13687]